MKRTLLGGWAALFLLLAAGVQGAESGFRNDGSGVYTGVQPPRHWNSDSNIVWKTKLAKWSNASPVVRTTLGVCCIREKRRF